MRPAGRKAKRPYVTVDLGLVTAVDAESFGEPGQRTFRLRVIGEDLQAASLWLEKQQLQALSLAITQVLAQLDYEGPPAPPDMSFFPEEPEQDFKVGRMAISFDSADETLVLHFADILSDDEDEVTVRFRMTQAQSAYLRERLDQIIEAGRPVCRLCGTAIDADGHVCIRANGHLKIAIPERDQGEEEP
jgi:uncharacterized repeat protein (TIGR03847 family)